MRYADLPLHYGKTPRWLFSRMVSLSGEICRAVVLEYGEREFIERIASPHWFQALSCAIGFDWHSSGTTTTTCGALKEALKSEELGLGVAGGKGKTSLKTPREISKQAERLSLSGKKIKELEHASKMSAKVDSAALQDSFDLYHHCIFFSGKGDWCVVQQGMNPISSYARRYHWNSLEFEGFLEEPHKAICCNEKKKLALNLTSKKSRENKKIALDLVRDSTEKIKKEFQMFSKQRTLYNYKQKPLSMENLWMPKKINWNALRKAYEFQPENYEEFLAMKGVGKGTIRALALISELIYGEKADWRDPVKYSFVVGGKDFVPFPVDRNAMDESTAFLKEAIKQANLKKFEKINALKRLKTFNSVQENLH